MAFVPVPNVAQAEIRCTLFAQKVELTSHWQNSGPITSANLTALALALDTWFVTELLPKLSDKVIFREVFCADQTVADGPTGTSVPPAGTIGGNEFEAKPGNVSACVSFRTGLRGRSRRGRNYLFGLTDQQVVGNTLSPTFMSQVTTAYSALLSPQAGFTWVVVSKFSGHTTVDGKPVPTPRPEGLVTPVNAVLFADDASDSQRRRLNGRGQ